MRLAVVKAAYDDDAAVWCVEHSDLDGLHVEGETFEAFRRNVADAVADLLGRESDGSDEVHVEIIAHASVRTRGGVRDFGKLVRDKLSEAGRAFRRHGKGDHDIWTTPGGNELSSRSKSGRDTPRTAF